jgi:hypothetical protein
MVLIALHERPSVGGNPQILTDMAMITLQHSNEHMRIEADENTGVASSQTKTSDKTASARRKVHRDAPAKLRLRAAFQKKTTSGLTLSKAVLT